jgi:1-deoxy-D-xylulose-5-phosphate reductoisomerase
MGLPDMRLPIQYAIGYPKRLTNNFSRFRFADFSSLTFEKADIKVFRNLSLAFEAMEKGGNMACIVNAANEVAVDAFLKSRTGFVQMSSVIEQTMAKTSFIESPQFQDYIETDKEARQFASEIVG